MNLIVLSGGANHPLADAVAQHLGIALGASRVESFPDGELHVTVKDSVRGHDVYLVQPTGPPVERHLLALLLLADACRRAGAGRLTAVVPYFGYARHDRRVGGREPVAARLVADLIQTAAVERLVAVDLHNPGIEGCFSIPVEQLSAVSILTEAVRPDVSGNAVVVAPDLGAAKLADRYASLLGLPTAVIHKTRVTGEEVSVRRITGSIVGREPLIVDDMISTAGTIEAAAHALLEAGCGPELTVVASHGLLVGPAIDRLRVLPLRRLVLTDSVPVAADLPLPLLVATLAPMLADAIRRLHEGRSMEDLISAGEIKPARRA